MAARVVPQQEEIVEGDASKSFNVLRPGAQARSRSITMSGNTSSNYRTAPRYTITA